LGINVPAEDSDSRFDSEEKKSGVSSSFLPEKMNRHRITRTGLREKAN